MDWSKRRPRCPGGDAHQTPSAALTAVCHHGQVTGSSSIRKTGGSACGTTKVAYSVAPPTLEACPGTSLFSTNTAPAGRPGPYVVELQSACVKVTAPDATVAITTPG